MDAKQLVRIISNEELTKIMVLGNGMYLRAFERDDESVDYTLYDADLSEIDGGVYDAASLAEAFQYIVSDCFCGQDLQIISEELTDEIEIDGGILDAGSLRGAFPGSACEIFGEIRSSR